MIEMERNEILMLTHQFRDMSQEDVYLAYYQIRKNQDIWEENKRHKDSINDDPFITTKSGRGTDI